MLVPLAKIHDSFQILFTKNLTTDILKLVLRKNTIKGRNVAKMCFQEMLNINSKQKQYT